MIIFKVEEEMAADYSDEEEEEILHIDDLQAVLPANAELEMAKPSEILTSNTGFYILFLSNILFFKIELGYSENVNVDYIQSFDKNLGLLFSTLQIV